MRIPLDGLVAADGWDARRPPGRASRARTLSGWCRASSRRGPETGRRWRSRRPRRAWRGALGGGELVEGAHGGERQRGVLLGDAEGPVVVDEVEEAPAAGGLGGSGGGGGEGRGEGEVDDGDGDARGREGRGGVGVRVHEDRGDGGDAGLDEAADARAGLVEGLEERGAVGLGRRSGGGRHGRAAVALGAAWSGVEGKGANLSARGGPWARRVVILPPSSVSSSPSPRWRWPMGGGPSRP